MRPQWAWIRGDFRFTRAGNQRTLWIMKGATLFGKCVPVTVCLGLAFVGATGLRADDDKKDSGGSLGDLFSKVKDLKIPDSVATLPAQLTELKDAYLKTAETVEQLRIEVDRLSEEVAALKTDNSELRTVDAVGAEVVTQIHLVIGDRA